VLESIRTNVTDYMDYTIPFWNNTGFRVAEAEAALNVVHQQLKVVNWGNAPKFGIIDRANRHLLLFGNGIPCPGDLADHNSRSNRLSVDWFMQYLQPADQQFVAESLEQVYRFLRGQRPEDYPNYRLSFDLCLHTRTPHAQRLMVHLRYLAPAAPFAEGLCLFGAHCIDSAQPYTPPLRAFCSLAALRPVLFRSGQGHFPGFSKKRLPLLEALRQGRSVKQIAQLVGNSEATVTNTLAYLRKQMYVANNTQLAYYYTCFYGY